MIFTMRKLNDRKIRWIIRGIENGRKIKEIARIQGITRVRVRQLYKQYVCNGFLKDIDELIEWYNYDKPHMSLNFENAETPEQVFWRKLPKEKIWEYGKWILEM